MFVAASTRCFSDLPFAEACQQLTDLGFERLEAWLDEAGRHLGIERVATQPDAFASYYRELTRIPLSAFCLAYEPPLAQFEGLCKTSKFMRITQITMPAAPHGTPFNSEIDRLKELVRVASLQGVRLSLKTEKGRLTEDLHTAAELCQAVSGLGLPVRLHLTAGQVADVTQAGRLVEGTAPSAVIADRGYDSAAAVAAIEATGAEAVVPCRRNRKVQRAYDRDLHRGRGVGENFWARVKQYRRVATRYDKTDECFLAFVHLASMMVMLR